MRHTIGLLAAAMSVLVPLGCTERTSRTTRADADVAITESPEEARAIAQEAYVYAYPMLENYRTLYTQAVDRNATGYQGPFNELVHRNQLLDPSFKDIVRPNNDTLYSFAWLDLRSQPVVVTVPEIGDRYYSVQLIDMFTNNIGYVGTRTTGAQAGSYLVSGPRWQGTRPANVAGEIASGSEFVYCIIRTEVRGPDDVANVTALQKQVHVTPLSVFLGRPHGPGAAGLTFPRYQAKKARSFAFIDYLNFLLEEVETPAGEASMLARFRKIGISPGAVSESTRLPPPIRDAINAGVGTALIEISKAALNLGPLEGVVARSSPSWVGSVGIFGDPSEMAGRYLVRAGAAMVGLYGNDAEEAYYPFGNADDSGDALDGAKHRYVMKFAKNELPPVDAFWSMTMYGLPNQLMVENPINRYSIGDRSNLGYDEDGSLTIYVQHEAPKEGHRQNWLPAPAGPFSLQFRMYLPAEEAIEAPLYLPPGIERVR
ncbi:MAG: DUF1254 domain-containing protein [Myxococcota bacterium]